MNYPADVEDQPPIDDMESLAGRGQEQARPGDADLHSNYIKKSSHAGGTGLRRFSCAGVFASYHGHA
jgi:hypothetical protein